MRRLVETLFTAPLGAPFVVPFVGLFAGLLAGLGGPAVVAQAPAGVAAAARALIDDAALRGARVGVRVVDLDDDAVLFSHDDDRGFMPASNMKLISSAVALRTLGPEYEFATRVVTARAPSGGEVGDLFLVGGGDPTLGGRPCAEPMLPMRALAEALWQRGVRKVAGAVVGDGSWCVDERYGRGWQWDYLEEDYAAPTGGLCFAENVCRLVVAPGEAAAAPVVITQVPACQEVAFESIARTLANAARDSRDARAHFRRELHGDRVHVIGGVALGTVPQVLEVAVADPARFAARALRVALLERGIAVTGEAVTGLAPERAVPLAALRSPRLAAIVGPLLRDSQNLYAEQVWRAAARHAGAGTRGHDAGRHAARVLAALGVDPAGMVLADGSGLSRRNLVQPRQLTALLVAIWRSELRGPVLASLPVAGEDGTLRGRHAAPSAARGRVRAKTGSIDYVACLSGYVPRPAPRAPLAFSIMLNNFTCTGKEAAAAIDRCVEALARQAGWTAAAAEPVRGAGIPPGPDGGPGTRSQDRE